MAKKRPVARAADSPATAADNGQEQFSAKSRGRKPGRPKAAKSPQASAKSAPRKRAKPASVKAAKRTIAEATDEAPPVAFLEAADVVFLDDEIGTAAGVIWRQLDAFGARSVNQLVRDTGMTRELLLAAIGWLSREEKLAVASAAGGQAYVLR